MDGVFAVNKPQGITSAQVIRDLQEKHFDNSDFFAPHLADVRQKRSQEQYSKSRAKRDRRTLHVKMGHGGTLDPLATGVLILGVGDGTKAMQSFIGCTKSYETVVLFGAATDTYDITGKVTVQQPWDGVTKATVTEALAKFRGKISQRPPIYSALWINGKRAYDIAREGGEMPEMKEREVEVTNIELLEYMEPGQHDFQIPNGEKTTEQDDEQHKSRKRKRGSDDKAVTEGAARPDTEEGEPVVAAAAAEQATADPLPTPSADSPQMSGAIEPVAPSEPPLQPPAARIRMTVSSGFYVRSLCHDIGEMLGSAGNMASLIRTRQGDFELGKNVLNMADFDEGEEVWAAKLKPLLTDWNSNGKVEFEKAQREKEEAERKEKGSKKSSGWDRRDNTRSAGRDQTNQKQQSQRKTYEQYAQRRNSSSEED